MERRGFLGALASLVGLSLIPYRRGSTHEIPAPVPEGSLIENLPKPITVRSQFTEEEIDNAVELVRGWLLNELNHVRETPEQYAGYQIFRTSVECSGREPLPEWEIPQELLEGSLDQHIYRMAKSVVLNRGHSDSDPTYFSGFIDRYGRLPEASDRLKFYHASNEMIQVYRPTVGAWKCCFTSDMRWEKV